MANAWTLSADADIGRVLGTRFETLGDEDWYKLVATSDAQWFVVETFGLDNDVDTVMELFTPPTTQYGRTGTLDSLTPSPGSQGLGHWMLRDDDGALAERGSRIAFQAPVAGTYYVRVTNQGTGVGSYYVAFEDVGRGSAPAG